ncbi:hypothetical protein D3C86_345490 [compost metagenome]
MGRKYTRELPLLASNKALVSDTALICVQFVPLLIEYHQVPLVLSAPTMAMPVSAPLSSSDVEPMKLLTEVPTAPVGTGAGTLAFKSSLMVDRLRVATLSTGASLMSVMKTTTESLALEKALEVPILTLVPAVPELWSQPRNDISMVASPVKPASGT